MGMQNGHLDAHRNRHHRGEWRRHRSWLDRTLGLTLHWPHIPCRAARLGAGAPCEAGAKWLPPIPVNVNEELLLIPASHHVGDLGIPAVYNFEPPRVLINRAAETP